MYPGKAAVGCPSFWKPLDSTVPPTDQQNLQFLQRPASELSLYDAAAHALMAALQSSAHVNEMEIAAATASGFARLAQDVVMNSASSEVVGAV